MKATLVLASLLAVGGIEMALADQADNARDLAATCANCHGTDGRSVGGIEGLAGEPAEKLYESLIAFRLGERPSTIMSQISRGYSEEQLKTIAGYFAAQR